MWVTTAGSIHNKDDLVIELMSRDLRNVNEFNKAYDLFVDNNHFFEFVECMDIITPLRKLKYYVEASHLHSNVIKCLNDINRSDITSEKFYDLLSSLPYQFSYYYHLAEPIDEVSKSRFHEKVNSILGEDSSTIFENNTFRSCVDNFFDLCENVETFYRELQYPLKTFSDANLYRKRNGLRNYLIEFCSSDFYASYDVLKMRDYCKLNVEKIGIYYYVRIVKILNMLGRYSFGDLNLELLSIARDADWVNNERQQLPEFRELASDFLTTKIISDDESTWKRALDILKELTNFLSCEKCFLLINGFMNVKRTTPYDKRKLSKFYAKIKQHVKDSEAKDFYYFDRNYRIRLTKRKWKRTFLSNIYTDEEYEY